MTASGGTGGPSQPAGIQGSGGAAQGGAPAPPEDEPPLSPEESEQLRRELGLSPLEWALSGSFAEQRHQTEPLVVPGFGGEPGETRELGDTHDPAAPRDPGEAHPPRGSGEPRPGVRE
jgi:hypothetical protein